MTQEVDDLLKSLHLEQYIENLRVNGIDNIALINKEALQNAGIDKVGHSTRILKGVENLTVVAENDTDNSSQENDETESFPNKSDSPPPPLPPKSKLTNKLTPQVPSRTVSIKPVKPPRRTGSLPHGFKPLPEATMDNYMKMPPVPPRQDLGELDFPPPPPEDELLPTPTSPDEVEFPETPEDTIAPITSPTEAVQPTATVSPTQSPKTSPTIPPRRTSVPTRETLPSPTAPHPVPAPRKKVPVVKDPSDPQRQQKVVNIIEDDPGKNNEEKTSQEKLNVCPEEKKEVDDKQPTERKISPEIFLSEDDLSDGEPNFPDNGNLDTPDEKIVTISMTKNNDNFEQYLQNLSSELSKGKTGYLLKKGGQKADKSIRRRYIEFNGDDLRYSKEKGAETKQIIPVSRMTDVVIETSAKKPTFQLITPNRTFTFIEPNGDQDEMTKWVSILMEAILHKKYDGCKIGGSMAEPDKEGWLSKQGHSIIQDFQNRYVAIKDDKLCYYRTFQDFEDDLPISSLDMSLVSLREDVPKLRLNLITHTQKIYVFEAENMDSYNSWKKAIEIANMKGLSDCKFLQKIQDNKSNMRCADCDVKNPVWASVNLFVVVCDECIGCHRVLGQKTSKARSILMDQKIWTNQLIELFQVIGNANANQIWAYKLPADDQIRPEAPRAKREEFVKEKYGDKRYFRWSENYGQPKELGDALRSNVVTENVIETLRLIVSGADVFYVPEESEDKRTPYELAKEAGMELQMELLSQYQGHLTEEQRQELEAETSAEPEISSDESSFVVVEAEKYDKSGLLMMRYNERENWREAKTFQLKGRKIEYKRSAKPEDVEYIDLTELTELLLNKEECCFTIRTSRTYMFKAFTPEDCESWHQTIRNKQAFGVALENQEVGSEKIPHVLQECFDYMENNAITETKTLTQKGIYRQSGSFATVKKLVIKFNQDPSNARLDINEYPEVHCIGNLLKQYLRDLPEPLLSQQLRIEFVSNTEDGIEHNERLYSYKDLVKRLPEINRLCLRRLVLHLNLVEKLSDFNLMTMDNLALIFGPIIVSCAKTIDQVTLNREYAVFKYLLTYYQWIFDVTDAEMKSQQAIIDFIRSMNQQNALPEKSNSINSMQIPLFIESTEDQMKMDNDTKPYDVCLYAMKKYNLDPTTDWGLFEVSNKNCFERPISSKEKILELALTFSTEMKLVVKENYMAEMLTRHQSASLGLQGYLHYSTKGEKWKKNYFVDIKHGNIRVSSKKDAGKEEDNIGIHEVLLYSGVVEKKSPGKYGFRLKLKNSNSKDGDFRYFCSDNEYEVNMFIAAILNIRYPTGIWSERCSKDLNQGEAESRRNSQFWGRQSAILQPLGASNRLIEQLQRKKGTLRGKK